MSPQRIQRKRTKGWRMPEDAVYVGRPTKWGNPFAVGAVLWDTFTRKEVRVLDRQHATVLYRDWLLVGNGGNRYRTGFGPIEPAGSLLSEVGKLAGRDLVCWCPLDQPCHADVLLELANPGGIVIRDRAEAAEARYAALVQKLTDLADEWDGWAAKELVTDDGFTASCVRICADELRRLYANQAQATEV